MSGPPINVIIPLGGLGSRFQKEGYLTRPKPFVRVLGKEMILWVVDNLSIRSDDGLVLVYNPSWMSMDVFMREILAAKYPQATLVELPGPTRGAAETVMLGLRGLDERVRGRATLLADGDTFYTADIVNRFREASTRMPFELIVGSTTVGLGSTMARLPFGPPSSPRCLSSRGPASRSTGLA